MMLRARLGEAALKEASLAGAKYEDRDSLATHEQQRTDKQVSCTLHGEVEIWPGTNIAVEPNKAFVKTPSVCILPKILRCNTFDALQMVM